MVAIFRFSGIQDKYVVLILDGIFESKIVRGTILA